MLLATLANSVGSATSLWLGSRVPPKTLSPRLQRWFDRFGPAVLSLATGTIHRRCPAAGHAAGCGCPN
ncbi:hypothetical protein [Paludibacterium denitrificans]|uniref:hypothetical protein n=1 Tax=Paludibacterium denitrificans TaxID=2675226 RepID=UPI001E644D0D|nr:hypothetical protein [Paludibacterium denitrificans]